VLSDELARQADNVDDHGSMHIAERRVVDRLRQAAEYEYFRAMNELRTVFLPLLLTSEYADNRAVVVFDVLRATTTMAAALKSGAKEIRTYPTLEEADLHARLCRDKRLLVGERICIPPGGFDLGNSPGDFTPARCADATLFMATTNGTRALLSARQAEKIYICSLVNAAATAKQLLENNLPITLLCAGTQGNIALEDAIGVGCLIERLGGVSLKMDDASKLAFAAWMQSKNNLPEVLAATHGGQNIVRVGLGKDIDFVAQVDSIDIVGVGTDIDGTVVVTVIAS
jgi:2-phosphosulfolactate phosphatase